MPVSVADSKSGRPSEALATSLGSRMSVDEIARRLEMGRVAVYAMREQGIVPGKGLELEDIEARVTELESVLRMPRNRTRMSEVLCAPEQTVTRVTSLLPPEVMSSCGRDLKLARRRLQQKGDLFDQGGMWKLRWHEDKIGPDGELMRGWSRAVHIGPSMGLGRLTEKEARRLGWENFLSKLDAGVCAPHSAITLGNFVDQRFLPEHVALLKRSGRTHYESMLKHVLPALTTFRLRDTTASDIQKLVSSMLAANYSVQTAKHVRTVVSAIFTHAKRLGCHTGDNPAKLVRLPEMVRREAHALSFDQAVAALAALKSPAQEMVLFAILTSMNIAEICGLQWKRINLTEQFTTVDGESLPPLTIAVRRQWYRGEFGSVKAKSRRRNLPIGAVLRGVLAKMKERVQFTGPDDPVFAARTGKPVDEHNIARRHLKPVGESLGMAWLSWHCFRRTHTTLANELGMAFTDRMAMMGHSEARMTALYTADDLQRRRTVLDQMAARLVPGTAVPAARTKQKSLPQRSVPGAEKKRRNNVS